MEKVGGSTLCNASTWLLLLSFPPLVPLLCYLDLLSLVRPRALAPSQHTSSPFATSFKPCRNGFRDEADVVLPQTGLELHQACASDSKDLF